MLKHHRIGDSTASRHENPDQRKRYLGKDEEE
jgi:hypothetical protein